MKTALFLLILALAVSPLTSAWVMGTGQIPDDGSRTTKDRIFDSSPTIFNDGGGWVPLPPIPPPYP